MLTAPSPCHSFIFSVFIILSVRAEGNFTAEDVPPLSNDDHPHVISPTKSHDSNIEIVDVIPGGKTSVNYNNTKNKQPHGAGVTQPGKYRPSGGW